jgi:hypothetical protein
MGTVLENVLAVSQFAPFMKPCFHPSPHDDQPCTTASQVAMGPIPYLELAAPVLAFPTQIEDSLWLRAVFDAV